VATIQQQRIPLPEVARIYGVTCRTVRNWTKRQRGPRLRAIKVGGQVFVTPEALEDFEQPIENDQHTLSDGERAVRDFQRKYG